MEVKVLTNILRANDAIARSLRERFSEGGVYCVDLMGSPGSGKTALLERTIEILKGRGVRVGVIEGDLATTLDAERIAKLDVPVVQINTGGGCHLEASMIEGALQDLPLSEVDCLFIENVGNLVCPADFDLGQSCKVTILSVPEGEDKPAKYPVIFGVSDAIIINKIDLIPYLDFDLDSVRGEIVKINPKAPIFPLSCLRPDDGGVRAWCDWLMGEMRDSVRGEE
ncbi:MAG: hydrogenase nickel incorporation protein HypB [bacterium]